MKKPPSERTGRIAVIGMACRMPGAANYDEYWNNLLNERCSIREIPAERWSKEEFYSPDPEASNKSVSKWGGFIDGVNQFDPMFFGISPREAQYMDPQQRIVLELASSCFEDAGYSQSKISGSRTGVYVGASLTDHWPFLQESQQPVNAYWATGCAMSVISNRISYTFNLNGPSMSIDTACSSSLMALHQGVLSLRSGECTMALIGGAGILAHPTIFTTFSKQGMLSPDGECRTFDKNANGFVRGEGAAMVLLKTEEQALADGDRIIGVICGSAVNHGGHAHTLTSPNPFSQSRVIIEAHLQAGVPPDSVTYIEAHGTGTPKGDPIEITGLKRAFAKLAQHSGVSLKVNSCAIGSVKPNIGHLEPVAGLAGLIKVLLCLQHKVLPKLVHFKKLNPRIELDGSPFYILDKSQPWLPGIMENGEVYPRRAGISAFGFGGANAHVVVEEAPQPAPRQGGTPACHLICLSAKTEEALEQRHRQLAARLAEKGQEAELRDLSLTLLLGRQHWEYRSAFPAQSMGEVREKLEKLIASERAADSFRGVSNKREAQPASADNPASAFMEKLRQQVPLNKDDYRSGLVTLAELFSKGQDFEWEAIFAGTDARRIALPTYPFAKKTFSIWGTPNQAVPSVTNPATASVVAPASAPATVPVTALAAPAIIPPAIPAVIKQPDPVVQRPRISLQVLPSQTAAAAVAAAPASIPAPQVAAAPAAAPMRSSEAAPSQPREASDVSAVGLQQEMRASLAAALYLSVDEVDVTRPFVEQGLDSVVGVEWMRALNTHFGLNIAVTKLYDYPNIQTLAEFIALEIGKRQDQESQIAKPAAVAVPVPEAPMARAAEVAGRQHKISLEVAGAVNTGHAPIVHVPVDAPHPAKPVDAPPPSAQRAAETQFSVSEQSLRQELMHSLAAALYMEQDAIQSDRPFVELGLDSVVGVEWIRTINKHYGLSMPATKLYDYATVDALAKYIREELLAQHRLAPAEATEKPDTFATANALPFGAVAANYGLTLTTVHVLDEVSLTEWVVPAPAAGEVTIRVFASALNFPDVMCLRGLYPTMPEYPFVPGFEVAGVISEVGGGTSGFKVGDEVIAVTGRQLGGHASYVNVPATNVIRKPKNMTFEEACSVPVIFSTVQHAFQVARLVPHEHVLIQTATGGCGMAALQMARLQSCVCYGTSSQPEKLAILNRIGVEHTINYKTTEFDSEIRKTTRGRGVDVVLNMLSGDAIQQGLNCLAPFGRYLEIAVHALRTSQKLDLSRLVHNQSVHSIDLRRMIMENGTSWSDSFAPLLPLFESRQLVPIVSRIYPVGQIVDAMRYITQGRHIGKVVISHTRSEMVDCTEQCIGQMIEQLRTSERLTQSRSKVGILAAPTRQAARPETLPQEDIAVIGMSGQFPHAKNLQQFWNNLKEGKDCVDEVPASRWPVAEHFDANGKVSEKTYCKWMGVLEDVDQFDPLFFNIAPAEARLMDPEQRLFLQNVWHCLEDAGIRPASIAGSRCGVFVGCTTGDYGLLLGSQRLNAHGLMGGAASILAGRVSYFFNLQGPCLSIDTACSSSLAAIAEACDSLLMGTSDTALAGGAYVMATPSMHIMTSQAGMLSPNGRCHTFDQGADGFVPGEGVGVVLLKRLSDAQRDKDRIYGVIKGWGIKQDGKTNGITAPSVNSQIALEKEIYQRFAINPEHISLIEAHGTGTKLGDPIEVEALTQSFRSYTDKKQYCALGSVKSNIGHGLMSAGIGGFIKVMLCMQHKKLVPSINYRAANEHINFADSPFFVNTEYRDWDAGGSPTRMAAMSSFGFSGTNVHLVMEESPVPEAPPQRDAGPQNGKVVILLSAKNRNQLKAYARHMHQHLKAHPELPLEDVAYTLQVGREPMDYRLAFTASSYENLIEKLGKHASGDAPIGVLAFAAGADSKLVSYFSADMDAQELLRTWTRKKDLEKLAELWLKGLDLDWRRLHEESQPRRVGLPGYAFAQERYWVSAPEARRIGVTPAGSAATGSARLHPLVHRNVSTFGEQGFQSSFDGSEFFFADHRVREKKVLPGAAQLEMARVAVMQSTDGGATAAQAILLRDVVWMRPIVLDQETVDIGIALEPQQNGQIGYQIYRQAPAGGQRKVHSTGSVMLRDLPQPVRLDLSGLRAECNLGVLSAENCYAAFRSVQLDYGPAHRGLERVYRGTGKALAKLRLPETMLAGMDDYGLHPALLDSALQACIGLLADETGALSKLALPYALHELQILGKCSASMWAFVRLSEGGAAQADTKMDIDLCGEDGQVCVRLRGFSLRATAVALAKWDWQTSEIASTTAVPEFERAGRMVVFCEMDGIDALRLRSRLAGIHCLFLDGRDAGIGLRFQRYAERVLSEIQRLFRHSSSGSMLLQIVYSTKHERQLFGALSGMLKAAQLENPLFFGQMIGFDSEIGSDALADRVQEESLTDDQRICYRDDLRHVAAWRVADAATPAPLPWKEQGVYLITGGAGGLGFIFADEIVQKSPTSRLILIGRSVLSAAQRDRMEALRPSGCVEYRQVDVADRQAVTDLIAGIQRDYGRLDGVIHSAGVVRDGFIRQKDLTQVPAVFAPKVEGVANLDHATQSVALDFFVVFSSMAGVIGNVGQADYAAANAFIDMYASYRDQLASQGSRHGKTLSINWPLWKEGGMQVDQASQDGIRRKIGMVGTEEGKQAFYQAMGQACTQVAVTAATPVELNAVRKKETIRRNAERAATITQADRDRVASFVVDVLVKVLKIPAEKLNFATPFEKYGIDSIVQATLLQEMEQVVGELPRTLLFEHTNIQELVEFLAQNYSSQLLTAKPAQPHGESQGQGEFGRASLPLDEIEEALEPEQPVVTALPKGRLLQPAPHDAIESTDIAIIGISGRYPQSGSLEALWQNLASGSNCVTRAPADRWAGSLLAGRRQGAEKDYFGGFLEQVDHFDHKLFDVPTENVLAMTPELRMFLEVVWETLEDAGYSKSRLQSLQDKDGKGVGVFVGSMYSQYGWTMPSLDDAIMNSNETDWQIANRVSHFFDLRGPSIAVNTACSSSMTAIHLACESLRQQSCSMAIAGGVNLTLDRSKYDKLRDVKILDGGPRSKSFGTGNGYVPGEGVGAVLLKPLALAIRDNDRIEGIIKSSFISHAGGRQKYTVPDPKRQTDLITNSIRRANVEAETITYVESAANGSPLGDPIEVVALSNAFEKFTKKKGFCALGSVKSNLGHLEAASGISQLSKVLLQLKHKTLVPSIHALPLNPAIKLANSAFYVQQERAPWHALTDPVSGQTLPRRCMINSFGAGGGYANLILEEYVAQPESDAGVPVQPRAQLCAFSAATAGSLHRYLDALYDHVKDRPNISVADVAASLRKINNDLTQRAAVVVTSREDMLAKLGVILDGYGSMEAGVFTPSSVAAAGDAPDAAAEGGDSLRQIVAQWVTGRRATLDVIAYDTSRPCLSLPKYAFEHDRAFNFSDPASVSNVIDVHDSSAFYRSIFEKVAQGALSEEAAWELVQTTET